MKKQLVRMLSGIICTCMLVTSFSGCAGGDKENSEGSSESTVNSDSSISSEISDNAETSGSDASASETSSQPT